MKLFLVRHGVAFDGKGSSIHADFERELTPEGRHECVVVARGLKRLGVRPEILFTSPLKRARQTADTFKEIFGVEPEILKSLSPGGSFSDIYQAIGARKALEVMLFGHEPGISLLAQNLLCVEAEMPFKKAGVARIDVDCLPSDSPGVLKWFLTPKIARMVGNGSH